MERVSARRFAIVLAVLSAAYVLIGLRLQTHWWTADDPYQLAYAGRHRPWDFFLSREGLAKGLIGLQFTPLQNLGYWIEYRLAPHSPGFAYFHVSVSLGLGAMLLFFVLRRWMGDAAAFTAALLTLLLPSTIVVAEFVSLQNYLDGLVLSLAGIWIAQRALSATGGRHLVMAGLAAVFFLLGSLAKELYVTTPFALLVALFASRRRWRAVAIMGVAGLAYVGYYRWLIGSLTSTFNIPTLSPAEYPLFLWRYPYVFAGGPAGWALAALFIAGLADGLRRGAIRGRDAAFAALLVAISIASLHPAAGALNATYTTRESWYRAASVSNIVIVAAGAWLTMKLARGWRVTMAAGAIVTLAVGAWLTVRTWDEINVRHRLEGAFYLDNPGKLVYSELPDWWFLVGIDDLYDVPERHYFLANRPREPGDAEVLARFTTIWRYSPAGRVFVPAPDLFRELTAASR